MTIQKDIRARDFFLYPVEVKTGANKIKIGAVTITITPGWYYQGFSTDTDYPGLWTAIEVTAPDGVTLHACTPTLSSGQTSCGLEIRAGSAVAVDISITDAIPPELIGWANNTTKTATRVKSDLSLPGIWRAASLVDGIADLKLAHKRQTAFKSHKGPRARFTKWESYDTIDWRYPAVEALYVIEDRCHLSSYATPRSVEVGDTNVNFERLWESWTRGRKALLVPDAEVRPDQMGALTVLSWGESDMEDILAIARLESAAQERYTLSFETYIADVVEEPS